MEYKDKVLDFDSVKPRNSNINLQFSMQNFDNNDKETREFILKYISKYEEDFNKFHKYFSGHLQTETDIYIFQEYARYFTVNYYHLFNGIMSGRQDKDSDKLLSDFNYWK